ncbi:GTP pyrophosphokinase [Paenibacillus jamilae]|uniref:HD domain-containing protein n=1 Tax=Paenibacillus jamilae TaxID=114136 RepID=UPI0007AB82A1|nr:HD domain-containing protein [Paenibacillus jamilae]KZE65057.1 GTP pyrophosphokinase [Paenibacillus jamilae]
MELDNYLNNAVISNELSKAINIAANLHTGQLDKGGNPYILHPLRVMMKMEDHTSRIVAVLHDVLEDTFFTIHDVENSEFSDEVIEALKAITRKKDESYMDFIRRCKQNELARKVKIADIEDNMDLSRIKQPTKKDYERIKKYEKALKELMRIEE